MNKMIKRLPVLLLAAVLLSGCAGKQSVSESGTEAASEAAASYAQISQEEAKEMMAVDDGHEWDIYDVCKMNIHGCLACEYCHTKGNGQCVQKDDMQNIYHQLQEADMLVLDNDGNMILTEGLVLQDEKIWREFLGRDIIPENNSCELYFEESDIEGFIEKLERIYPEVRYVNRLMTHSWGQRVVRFYDPDGNLIEVGTPM